MPPVMSPEAPAAMSPEMYVPAPSLIRHEIPAYNPAIVPADGSMHADVQSVEVLGEMRDTAHGEALLIEQQARREALIAERRANLAAQRQNRLAREAAQELRRQAELEQRLREQEARVAAHRARLARQDSATAALKTATARAKAEQVAYETYARDLATTIAGTKADQLAYRTYARDLANTLHLPDSATAQAANERRRFDTDPWYVDPINSWVNGPRLKARQAARDQEMKEEGIAEGLTEAMDEELSATPSRKFVYAAIDALKAFAARQRNTTEVATAKRHNTTRHLGAVGVQYGGA